MPKNFPLYLEPSASAASSTTGICHLLQISLFCQSHGKPKVCIGKQAEIFSEILLKHEVFLITAFSSKISLKNQVTYPWFDNQHR